MADNNKITELNDNELEKVSGGYNPDNGSGLPVGNFLCHSKCANIFYKITCIDRPNYFVETYKLSGTDIPTEYVLNQIGFIDLVHGNFVPCAEPAGIEKVTTGDYHFQ